MPQVDKDELPIESGPGARIFTFMGHKVLRESGKSDINSALVFLPPNELRTRQLDFKTLTVS